MSVSLFRWLPKIEIRRKKAIFEFKQKILKLFPGAESILYGSKARGDFEEFSDIDILVLLNETVETKTEDTISDIAYDIELKFGVVISVVVESKRFWKSALAKAMPFHWNVDREGMPV